MKRIMLILVILCNMIVWGLPANTLLPTHHLEKKNNPIDLMGDLMATGVRSLCPIIVTQYDDYLEVILVDNKLGEISIQISDNMNNLLYQNTINGDQEQTLIIPFPNLKNRKYEIKFMNSQGKYLKGEFVIQR